MKRIKLKYFVVVLSVVGLNLNVLSQSNTPCGGSGAPSIPVNTSCSYSTVTISGSATYQTNANNFGSVSCGSSGEDVWYSFTAPSTGSVVIETASGSITDAVMALYEADCSTYYTEIACDDDGGSGTMPQIGASGLTPGQTYYIRFWEYGGGTGDFSVCVTEAAAAPTNVTCSVPDPICSGSPIVFTAQSNGTEADVVNPGNDYDCLYTSPNPSWYYLEISGAGDLSIDITAGSDVDFAIWGPFASLSSALSNCDSYGVPLDCSYSSSEIEQANVSSVSVGEVYVLLVTNYANTIQTITVNDAATNTATTNCAIVPLPVELISFDGQRDGDDVKLTWATATEKDNDYFIVERSDDAKLWNAFAIVSGAGNSSDLINYEAYDRNAEKTIQYYRLKQVDFNGAMTIYDMISVDNSSANMLKLYPNPAQNQVSVLSIQEFNKVVVTDVTGVIVGEYSFDWMNQYNLSLENVQSGLYYVTISTRKEVTTERLVIKQ